MITPEAARQELAARAAARQAQTSTQITPKQARQELVARSAMRAQQQSSQMQQPQPQAPSMRPQAVQQQPSFIQQGLQNIRNIGEEVGGAQEQLAFNPLRAGKVATASALNTAQGLANIIGKAVHYGTGGLSPNPNMGTD